jgi:uncharacterized protein (DUF4415 family)
LSFSSSFTTSDGDQDRAARPKRLAERPDHRIDAADIPEVTDWSDAVRNGMYRPRKQPIIIRLDADIIAWFRARSDRYQTEINRALRRFVAEEEQRARRGAPAEQG